MIIGVEWCGYFYFDVLFVFYYIYIYTHCTLYNTLLELELEARNTSRLLASRYYYYYYYN